MDLAVFDRHELTAVLRALKDVAAENGTFTDAERDLVESVARMHGLVLDARALAPISPDELAAMVTDPHKRKRAIQLAIVTSLVEGAPGDRTHQALVRFAQALDVPEGALDVLHEVAHGHLLLARFDMMRRLVPAMFRGESIPKTLASVLPALGLVENRAMAAKYHALGALPRGTFGRAIFDHYKDHGFAFPGDKNGIVEKGIFHDAGHVLSGYGVDPAGEIQQAAFQAGFMRTDGFVVFLFAILQFHLGLRLTPIAKGETGYFDPKRVLCAAERGATCKVDLSSPEWDLWSVVEVPLEELRARYGIPPVVESADELVTPRLRLRDLAPSDAEAMLRVEGDPEAVRWQSYEPRTLESCRAYLAADLASRTAEDRSCFDLAVTLREDERWVGRLGLDVKRPERSVGGLWFILDRALWGQGLMTEGARALVDFGFASGLHRIELECDPRNGGAARLADKLGMTREAHLRENVRIKGEWCDSLVFAVVRPRPSR